MGEGVGDLSLFLILVGRSYRGACTCSSSPFTGIFKNCAIIGFDNLYIVSILILICL